MMKNLFGWIYWIYNTNPQYPLAYPPHQKNLLERGRISSGTASLNVVSKSRQHHVQLQCCAATASVHTAVWACRNVDNPVRCSSSCRSSSCPSLQPTPAGRPGWPAGQNLLRQEIRCRELSVILTVKLTTILTVILTVILSAILSAILTMYYHTDRHTDCHTTGFRFMANKQFRMEKRLGTSVCADTSQYALKNQYINFLYEKTTQHIFFDDIFFFVGF